MCTRRKAFDGVNDANIKLKIINYQHPSIPDDYSPELIAIYNMCMAKDQKERPKVAELLNFQCVID